MPANRDSTRTGHHSQTQMATSTFRVTLSRKLFSNSRLTRYQVSTPGLLISSVWSQFCDIRRMTRIVSQLLSKVFEEDDSINRHLFSTLSFVDLKMLALVVAIQTIPTIECIWVSSMPSIMKTPCLPCMNLGWSQ